ncbi:nitroreductase family deazaflavin-dependent oxidoreductase [Actinoplanes sp. CA-030573]|uniref:nitroreductase family deazaflavin-dependent oxidoreductase n=1 Tax=Actinoplanes sp. CA-030573 TaxID=3239898 RepID=UPI003D9163BE
MDENTRTALHHSQLIDLTTTGRRTGRPRRIEIFLHEQDGRLFITGMPRADRTRDWIHNITADPDVVVHLKQSVAADIPMTARVVTDPDERRPYIEAAARRWGRTDVEEMVRHSPLIVLTMPDAGEQATAQ